MVKSNALDPDAMTEFCHRILVRMLHEGCHVPLAQARAIGDDVLFRAEAFAGLTPEERDILMAPFVEEVFDHEPADASLELKAAVAVVVRNSLLEDAHAHGPVNDDGLTGITTTAAAPLSHLLAARRRRPVPATADNPFVGFDVKYPRAWACLAALVDGIVQEGRVGYRSPEAPVLELPAPDEQAVATKSKRGGNHVVFSAIDRRFDHRLIEAMQGAAAQHQPLFVSSLSRISRSEDKLLRVLEYLLAHDVTVLTSNYMLRSHDVWVRRRKLVKPDSHDPHLVLQDLDGLSGAHREVVRLVGQMLTDRTAR